jgi:hypothetical protein
MLMMVSPLSHAFVSYGEPASAPLENHKSGYGAKPVTRGGSGFYNSSSNCTNKVGVVDLDIAPRKPPITTTRGNDIPLSRALRSILPKGWHADKGRDVDFDLRLSWEKGEDLIDVLTSVAFKSRLAIQIEWM